MGAKGSTEPGEWEKPEKRPSRLRTPSHHFSRRSPVKFPKSDSENPAPKKNKPKKTDSTEPIHPGNERLSRPSIHFPVETVKTTDYSDIWQLLWFETKPVREVGQSKIVHWNRSVTDKMIEDKYQDIEDAIMGEVQKFNDHHGKVSTLTGSTISQVKVSLGSKGYRNLKVINYEFPMKLLNNSDEAELDKLIEAINKEAIARVCGIQFFAKTKKEVEQHRLEQAKKLVSNTDAFKFKELTDTWEHWERGRNWHNKAEDLIEDAEDWQFRNIRRRLPIQPSTPSSSLDSAVSSLTAVGIGSGLLLIAGFIGYKLHRWFTAKPKLSEASETEIGGDIV